MITQNLTIRAEDKEALEEYIHDRAYISLGDLKDPDVAIEDFGMPDFESVDIAEEKAAS
jgi:hypothetical protein